MYPTKNSISEKIRSQIIGLLQVHLSNSIDLVTQSKQAHWNVKGPDFISLHELFDKVAEDSEAYVDVIAERIVQLGGTAEGTLKIAASRSQLPEYPLHISAGHLHVKALASTLASYGEQIRNAIHAADEVTDKATADIFTEISRGVDQYLWFVEAHLQGER